MQLLGRSKGRWRAALGPAAIVATVLALFGRALGPGQTLSFRDTDRLYAPVRTLVDDALRSGRLPLWNPYECMGKPLLGEGVHGVLTPLSVASAWVAPHGVDFLEVSYLLAAALGAYALARRLGASRTASVAAGLCYGLSGYVVSMTGNLVFLAGAAAMPWVPAAASAAGAGAPFGPFATALATGVAFLSGDTQAALVGGALGVGLAWAAGGRRGAGRALLGASVGVLLASVQILASRSELLASTRGVGLGPEEAVQWPLHPVRILEWIVPGMIRGDVALPIIPEVIAQGPLAGSFAESVYVGAPTLVLGFVGLWSARADPSRRRTAIVLTAALVLLVWIALGHRLGARQLLQLVPIWSRFRYSEKMMAPIALCLGVAAALGVDRAAAARLPRGAVVAAAIGVALSASALAVLNTAPGAVRPVFTALDDTAADFLFYTLRRGLVHPFLGLGALLAVDRLRTSATPVLVAGVAAGAVVVAAPFGFHLGTQLPHDARTPFAFEAPAPGPRIAHPYDRTLAPTASLDFIDTNAMLLRTILLAAVNVEQRIDNVDCYGAFLSTRRGELGRDVGEWVIRVARRFGMTHVVVVEPGDHGQHVAASAAIVGGHLEQSLEDPPVEVWAVPHRPWAFFAASALAVPTTDEAAPLFRVVSAPSGSDSVVVETTDALQIAPGTVLSVGRGEEEVRIEAESSGPALLVVNDAFWPGWRAFVDGQETEILAADLIVRAVRWPQGRHTLVMRYDPPEVRSGLVLSGAGALAAAALVAYATAAARRRLARADPA